MTTFVDFTDIVPGATTLLLGSACDQVVSISISRTWSVPNKLREEMPVIWLMKPDVTDGFAPNVTAQVVRIPDSCDIDEVLLKLRESGTRLPGYRELEGGGPQVDSSGWRFSYARGEFSVESTEVYTELFASSYAVNGETGLCVVQFSCARSDVETISEIREMSDSIVFHA